MPYGSDILYQQILVSALTKEGTDLLSYEDTKHVILTKISKPHAARVWEMLCVYGRYIMSADREGLWIDIMDTQQNIIYRVGDLHGDSLD